MEDSTIKDALTTLADYLKQNDYEQALSFWSSQKEELSSYVYWHNLGVIHKLQKDFPRARYAFEKAQYSTLYSGQTAKELNEVVDSMGFQSSQEGNLGEWAVSLGVLKLWIVALVVSFLFLACLRRQAKWALNLLWIILAIMPLGLNYFFLEHSLAFVSTEKIPLYNGASTIFASGQELAEGSRLIGFKRGNWLKVRSVTGHEMWIKNGELKEKSLILWGNLNE